MHLAILRTGQTNKAISDSFPDYPEMFARLLNRSASDSQHPRFTFTSFAVFFGELPAHINDFDGYILTGSAAGVYETHSWLEPLFAFIRACDAAKKPICGICFGHQAVAKALGGEVVKWPDGWGVGVRDMQAADKPDWMAQMKEFSLIYFHQDQVTKLPAGAKTIATSSFCTIGGFAKDGHIFCLQGHPEFGVDYSAALLETIRARVGDARTDSALASLTRRTDAEIVASWIGDFFTHSQKAEALSAVSAG